MMDTMEFPQRVNIYKGIDDLSEEEIKNLPQFFRADRDFAWGSGNETIQTLLSAKCFNQRNYRYCTIDSRTHMLMPRMYPCIPGWHCDDFYRPNGQPDLKNVEAEAPIQHFVINFGDACTTEFVRDPFSAPLFTENVYRQYHALLEVLKPSTFNIVPGEILEMGPLVFHKGNPAKHRGWRHFFRLSFSNHLIPQNELRTQTQVYLTEPFVGW